MGPNMLVKGVLLTIVFALFGLVAPLGAQEATFTDLHDVVPNRCFSAPLSTVGADFVDIGIESGFDSATWINKACKASTSAFHARTVGDTFTVTVTAPPGMRITRVTYAQAGTRYLERSTYWTASGTGTLTVNGVPLSFTFTTPTLSRTVDLADQDVESATVSVMIRLAAGRSSNFPRVTDPPGSARIDVTDAVIRVEYESVPASNHAPVALAVDGTITGTIDQPLVFDGSPSSDQDQDALSYQWDFGDGTSASGAVVTHSYSTSGTYDAVLTVSDGLLSSTYAVRVEINDAEPCTDSFDRSGDAPLGAPDGAGCPPGSTWSQALGTLFVNANRASNAAVKGTHLAVLPSIAGAKQTVEAYFTSIQDNNPSPRFGVVLRYQGPQDYYLVSRLAGATRGLRISRIADGVETVLKHVPAPNPVPGRTFRLKGSISDNVLTLELDGVPKASAADGTFGSGSVGLYIATGSGRSYVADNFSASAE